jgi:ABC-type multidrug transport system permease subunit
MARLLLMVRKDLLRRARSPLGYLVALAFPVVFALLIALAFGRGSVTPRVHLLVENRDEGFLGNLMVGSFQSDEMARYFQVEEVGEEGHLRMEKGDASALLVIPEGFTEDLLYGEETALQLVRNPAQSILPYAAEEAGTVLTEGLSAASRVLRAPLDDLAGMMDLEEAPADVDVASLSVLFNQTLTRVGDFLFPPVITLETATLAPKDGVAIPSPTTGSIFLIILPGVSVFGLFMVGDLAMRDLLVEAGDGTLRRQLAGPVSPAMVVAAKALFAGVLTLATLAILSAVGWSVSPRGVDTAGFLVLSLALVVAVTGLSSVLYGASRSESQGSAVGTLLNLGMAMIGGSFVQLDALPASIRRFSPLSLFYWGNTGYRELLQRGGGVIEILPHAGILAGVGALLLGLGAWMLGRKARVAA